MYTNIIAAASQHWVRVCIHQDKITTLALVQRGGTKEGRGEEEAQEGIGKGKAGGPKGGDKEGGAHSCDTTKLLQEVVN